MAIASTEIFNQHQQTSGTIVQVQQISTSSQQNVTGAIRSSTTSKIHLNMNTSINVQDYSINMNPPNININTNGNDNHNHNPPPKILENIETSSDCFEEKTSTEASPGSSQEQYDRTLKVAKKRYSDHGSHGVVLKTSLLNKMTTSLQDMYEHSPEINNDSKIPDPKSTSSTTSASASTTPSRSSKKRISPSSPSTSSASSNSNTNIANSASSSSKPTTSLLHAALQQQDELNKDGGGIGSTSTKASSKTKNPKGECLTNPKEPDSNNNLDNVEGNLIVFKNDLIRIPNQNIRQHKHNNKTSPSKTTVSQLKNSDPLGMTTYQVCGLLGQGTFAQVFKCKNIETGEFCAVKIVKNKPAYTRQATTEIDVFIALSKETPSKDSIGIQLMENKDENANDYMVSLLSYFMYQSHLCLVFELLGLNLYELLKRRQFRGLPIDVVRELVKQAIHGTNMLSQKNIVHCDLKPENILVVSDEAVQCMVNDEKSGSHSKDSDKKSADTANEGQKSQSSECKHRIKLIDFGSACFEGQAAHTYIQSRFYRSPEVLIGLDYDTAIDMWSLGCVAAELFLGLPILPGIHEHDQLGRICEMIGDIPDWMLEQGKKASKYFTIEETKPKDEKLNILQTKELTKTTWRLKTREEFIKSISKEEKKRCGGQSRLEQQPTNRYFKKKILGDIVSLHGNCSSAAEKESLTLFIHFLKGILNPDPCERWTAFQASTHPFLTGIKFRRRSLDDKMIGKGKMKITKEIYWSTPWDPSVCRRILSLKRNRPNRSGRSNLHKSLESHKEEDHSHPIDNRSSHLLSPTTRVTDMAGALSISFDQHHGRQTPPQIFNRHGSYGNSIPQPYHTPTSSNLPLTVGSLPLQMVGPNSAHFAQPPVNLAHQEHFDGVDMTGTAEQLMVPSLSLNVGAQSFSGAFHSGGVAHGLQGDLGYALQRPGVVPAGSGISHGHMNQVQQMNPMYMHHPQPPQYQMPQYLNSSSYNGHSSDMGHFSSSSYTGLPTHFTGPLSPQNHQLHHMATPQDHLPPDVAGYPYGSSQMHLSQQYQMYQQEHPGRDEPRRGSSWSNYANYRGSSM